MSASSAVVTVVVTHDGARWLPGVLAGLAEQTEPVQSLLVVDTGSSDDSLALVLEAFPSATAIRLDSQTSFPAAIEAACAAVARDQPDAEWLWLVHDDARPDPGALAALLRAAARYDADVVGPKLREWPSLKRLLEVGVTITGTGSRETGLERGEYDQGQHDEPRQVLAVNTAGMLVRRQVLTDLGGFDEQLPIFGNDVDFGWRAATSGFKTMVAPEAVVFHAEAAHRGLRRTPLTGSRTHLAERRAAIFTLLANAPRHLLLWRTIRIAIGTLWRFLGFLLVRAVGEAIDELAAVAAVYRRPGAIAAARRQRERQRSGPVRGVHTLLAPWWLPYRHGLDAVSELLAAATNQAADVAERRREARLAEDPRAAAAARRAEHADDDEVFLTESGWLVRFLTNPIAVLLTVVVLALLVGARHAFTGADLVGGALSPAPESVTDWWRLHLQHWHPLGTGTQVPAPAYVPVLALLGTLVGAHAALVLVFVLGPPLALWGAWRLLRVLGRLVDHRGLPRPILAWGAVTYALVPVVSGAWGQGRFATVVAAALLPWAAHAALGFADPTSDRRWRASWRTGVLLALISAFVPAAFAFALVLAVLALVGARLMTGSLPKSGWAPPMVALAVPLVLLAPWWIPVLTVTGGTGAAGLVLEAGRLPIAQLSAFDLAVGRLGDPSAPWWLGAIVAALALAALLPRATRVAVTVCWVVALSAAVVAAAMSHLVLTLPAVTTRPSLSPLMLVLHGSAIVAACLGGDAFLRRVVTGHPGWQRAVAALLAVVAVIVPLGGLGWWLTHPEGALTHDRAAVVPAYMAQNSKLGARHGVLVIRGSVDEGIAWRIRRDDGVTVGEDEILALATPDPTMVGLVEQLVSHPTPTTIGAIAAHGVEYIVYPAPADGRVTEALDATPGLARASAEDRDTRAWHVDRALDDQLAERGSSPLRAVLLVVQALGLIVVLVMCLPTLDSRRRP